jgi:hypothetical protein
LVAGFEVIIEAVQPHAHSHGKAGEVPRSLSVIDYPITAVELKFLRQLVKSGTEFMVVGMSSAILQGADVGTRDIDLWFGTTSDGRLAEAARSVGGNLISKAKPPYLGGEELNRFDVVIRMDGLGSFQEEYRQAIDCKIDDFTVKLLPLDRVIASKTASGREKDRAAMPALLASLKAKTYL